MTTKDGKTESAPKVRKRPDRSVRNQEAKNSDQTIVKCCLLKRLRGDDEVKLRARAAITNRVTAFSQRARCAGIALQHILKNCAAAQPDDAAAIQFPPNLLDQTFVRQLFLGTDSANLPEAAITSFYQAHPWLHTVAAGEDTRHSYDQNMYTHGAKKYLTNLKTQIVTNLERRVRVFTRQYAAVVGEEVVSEHERRAMVCQLMGWPLPPGLGCMFPVKQAIQAVVDEHRRILNADAANTNLNDWWAKQHREDILRYYIHLNRFRAANNLKLFDIAPVCHIKTHFITIDTDVLYGIMRDAQLISNTCTKPIFQSLGCVHWQSFFEFDSLRASHQRFTGTIETDGVAACVHFLQPKRQPREQKLGTQVCGSGKQVTVRNLLDVSDSSKRYVAVDGGRCNIMTVAEKVPSNENGGGTKYVQWVLTREQYYKEAGIKDARRLTEDWHRQPAVKEALLALANASTKGVDLAAHEAHIETYRQQYHTLWLEYIHPRWAQQRMRLFGGKKRVFANFFNSIQARDPSKEVVVGYGSAKFAPGGKGEVSVPVCRAFKECCYRFRTLVVDEFRTTMVHHESDSILKLVRRKDNNTKLRDLLWCESTSPERKSKFVSRDFNAAINILRCLTLPIRPLALTRIPGQAALAYVTGKLVGFRRASAC